MIEQDLIKVAAATLANKSCIPLRCIQATLAGRVVGGAAGWVLGQKGGNILYQNLEVQFNLAATVIKGLDIVDEDIEKWTPQIR